MFGTAAFVALPFALPFLPVESDIRRFRVRHRRSVSLWSPTFRRDTELPRVAWGRRDRVRSPERASGDRPPTPDAWSRRRS